SGFGRLSPLPRSGRPISLWHEREKAYEEITEGLRALIDNGSLRAIRESRVQAEKEAAVEEDTDRYESGIWTHLRVRQIPDVSPAPARPGIVMWEIVLEGSAENVEMGPALVAKFFREQTRDPTLKVEDRKWEGGRVSFRIRGSVEVPNPEVFRAALEP